MNRVKTPVTPVQEPKKKAPSRFGAARKYVRFLNVFGIFSIDMLLQVLPFIFFLMGLGLLYISNSHQADSTIRDIDKLNKELKSLRTEYIIGKSELMFASNQSEVARLLEPMGIKESMEAPMKITMAVKEEEE